MFNTFKKFRPSTTLKTTLNIIIHWLSVFSMLFSSISPMIVQAAPRHLPQAQSGTVYYVSETGDDNNSGTSSSTPWQTIAKANATLQAGDTVEIMAGDYDEQIRPANSGNEDDGPITYTNYNEDIVKIQGSVMDEPLVDLEGRSYIIIDSLTLNYPYAKDDNDGEYHWVHIISTSEVTATHNVIRKNIITIPATENTFDVYQGFNSNDKKHIGIALRKAEHTQIIDNVITGMRVGIRVSGGSRYTIIRDNTISSTYQSSIVLQAPTGNAPITSTNEGILLGTLIESNTLEGSFIEDGIQFQQNLSENLSDDDKKIDMSNMGTVIRDNTIRNHGENAIDLKGAAHVLIEENMIYGTIGSNNGVAGNAEGSTRPGDGTPTNPNYNRGAFNSIGRGANSSARDVIIRHNILYDNSSGIRFKDGFKIYNNTLVANNRDFLGSNSSYVNPSNPPAPQFWGVWPREGAAKNAAIKNNIILKHQSAQTVLRLGSNSSTNSIDIDYNLYDGQNVDRDTNESKDLATWQSLLNANTDDYTGNDAHSFEIDSGTNSPFVNVPALPIKENHGQYNFGLSDGSPAIDEGGPLTTVVEVIGDKTIKVNDAGYFFDGFHNDATNLADIFSAEYPGNTFWAQDMIQIGDYQPGVNEPVKIDEINYENNTITLAQSITVQNGDPVYWPYTGSAPDIGALEFGLDDPNPDPTPTPTATATPTSGGGSGGNLLPNPSFESDPNTDYSTDGDADAFTWANEGYTDSRSLLIDRTTISTEPYARWFSKRERVLHNSEATGYTLSGYFKSQGAATDSLQLVINYWDAGLNPLSGTSQSAYFTPSNDWQAFGFTTQATPPANAVYVRAEFRLHGSGSLWIDQVELTAEGIATPTPTPTMTPTVTPTPVATNLLPNPSFESDPNIDYSTDGNLGTFEWANEGQAGSNRSLFVSQPLTTTTDIYARWFSKRERVVHNSETTAYTLSGYFKSQDTGTDSLKLVVNYWDADLSYIEDSVQSAVFTPNNDWQAFSFTTQASPPVNAVYVRAEFRLHGGGSLWIDNVSLVESEPVTPPDDDRVTDGLLALYTFEEGSGTTVQDTSGVGTPLDLTIADETRVVWGADFLTLDNATLASGGPATKLIDAAKANNEITLEAWIKPTNVLQDGPAQIVSISGSSTERNLTLGQGLWGDQSSDLFNARLRTNTTNENGSDGAISSASRSATTGLTHLVYTRDINGQATLYINGQIATSDTVAGDFSTWNDSYQLLLGDEVTGNRSWSGELHLVAIYDRALTAADVLQNFATVEIDPRPLPTANFTVDRLEGPAPLRVNITDQSSEADLYEFDFEEGTPLAPHKNSHLYTEPGEHTLSLVVTNPTGNSTPKTVTINVLDPVQPELIMTLNGSASVVAGDPINYSLSVENTGTAPAYNVVATNKLPSGATYVSGGTLVGNTVQWTIPQLDPGQTTTPLEWVATADNSILNAEYEVVASQEQETLLPLLPTDTASVDEDYGRSVALSGNRAAVTSKNASIYIFERDSSSGWQQSYHLVGYSGKLALQGDTLVVAQSSDDELADNAGAIYIFEYNGAYWEAPIKMMAPDGVSEDYFGSAIALDGDIIVVGAEEKDDQSGAVYTLERSGGVWGQPVRLPQPTGSIFFGDAVAIDGNTIAVSDASTPPGMPYEGAVYLYEQDGSSWSQSQILTPPIAIDYPLFGTSIALDDGLLLVGAPGENVDDGDGDPNDDDQVGAAYIFEHNGTEWTQSARLIANDGDYYMSFGTVVDIDKDIAVISTGAYVLDAASPDKVYVFRRSGSEWIQQNQFNSDDFSTPFSGQVDDNRVIVAAPNIQTIVTEPDGPGNAYIHDLSVAATGETIVTTDIDNQTLAHWPFDESSGTRFDATDNNHDLPEVGTVGTVQRDGNTGVAPAGGNYLSTPDGPLVQGNLTIAGWFKLDDVTDEWQTIVARHESDGDKSFRLDFPHTGKVRWTVTGEGASNVIVHGTTPLVNNQWYHVAAVFDASAQQMQLYFNGVLDDEKSTGFSQIRTGSGSPLKFGKSMYGGLDDWYMFDRVLTPEEIAGLYDGSWPYPEPTPSFASYGNRGFGSSTNPLGVTFTNESTDADQYVWDFGDSSDPDYKNDPSPTHYYNTPGTYDVSLIAIGPGGSESTTKVGHVVVVDSSEIRGETDLQAIYTFTEGEGAIVHDLSGVEPALDLTINDATDPAITWNQDEGTLSLNTSNTLSSGGPATKLINAIQANQELTLEAWLEPANTSQDGPARIVSISGSADERNVTLGQGLWGDDPSDLYNVRLRTSNTNLNGSDGVIASLSGSLTTDLTHVVYTRDPAGQVKLYLNGVEVAEETIEGDFLGWDSTMALLLGNETTGDRPWLGTYHLVAIYNRALSLEEVADNYGAGAAAGPVWTPPLVVDFGTIQTTVPANFPIQFLNYTTNQGDTPTYLWDFGDGNTSTEASPTHTYSTPGDYTVSLTVNDGQGQEESEIKTDFIEVIASDEPLAHWPLEETGGTRTDDTGNEHHLAETASIGATDGQDSLGASFLGNAHLFTNDGPLVSQDLTVAGWVKLDDAATPWQTLIARYENNGGDKSFQLQVGEGGQLRWALVGEGVSGVVSLDGDSVLGSNTWYHVAGVFEASSQQMRLYVNGTLDGEQAAGFGQLRTGSGSPLKVGHNLSGALDDVYFYDRVLTPEELAELMGKADRHFYVDQDATTGANDGTAWSDAYTELQSALTIAQSGDTIWVADGTYLPDYDVDTQLHTGDRMATFQLPASVAVYGGFDGTETSLDQRNWQANETILSGDLAGNDDDFTNNDENSYHVVVTSPEAGTTTILDGFTLTGGNANDSVEFDGGGLYSEDGSPTLVNLTFINNTATNDGGGMFNWKGSPTLTNITFENNVATADGGGLRSRVGNPILTNITFTNNEAKFGGGMFGSNGDPTLTNVVFNGNTASQSGGGLRNNTSNPTLTHITFYNNTASARGGGMHNWDSNPVLVNTILWGNSDTHGIDESAQIHNEGTSAPVVNYSLIQDWASGGTGNLSDDPLFVDAANGDLHLQPGSPAIDAGDNGAVPAEVTTDLDGNARLVNATVDMGAYEATDTIIPSPEPLAHWPLEETSGSRTDATGNEHHLAETASIGATDGQDSQGASLPGNAHLFTADGPLVSQDLTVAGWVKLNATTDPWQTLISRYENNGGDKSFQLQLGTEGRLRWALVGEGVSGVVSLNGDTALSSDIWYHVAGVYEASSQQMRLYVNGSLDGEQSAGFSQLRTGSNSPLKLGNGLAGVLDDWYVYDRVLTVEELAVLMNKADRHFYVDKDVTTSANDGTSWADAFTELQSALTIAQSGDTIWVADGTYLPDYDVETQLHTEDRTATFQLKSGVAMYGGFNGTETSLDQRDWQANETILSGDLLDDDGTDFNETPHDDNSHHVVNSSGTNPNTILDGFTIRAGNGDGGPISDGGGLYNGDGSPALTNLIIKDNRAGHGGGMFNWSGNPTLTNVTFSNNVADPYLGGGFYNREGAPKLTQVIFEFNSALSGGGVYNYDGASNITNAVFRNNTAGSLGGGLVNRDGTPTLINVTFSGNESLTDGGGIVNLNDTLTLVNAILWGNTDASGDEQLAQINDELSDSAVINHSFIQGWPDDGSMNQNTDPLFVDAVSGDLRLQQGSPATDAGDTSAVPATLTTDLAGNPRIINGIVDIGAYEATMGGEVTGTITPEEGGEIVEPFTGAQVIFPSGAVEQPVVVTMTEIEPEPIDALGLTPIVTFDLQAFTLDDPPIEVTEFAEPVTIVVPYDEGVCDQQADPECEEILTLFWRKDLGIHWYPFADSQALTDLNQVVGTIDHFSQVSIMNATDTPLGPPEGITLPSVSGIGSSEFTGAATMNVPIEIPPVAGGSLLNLSLNYSSDVVNSIRNRAEAKGEKLWSYKTQASIYGLGWDLAGLPMIGQAQLGPFGHIFQLPSLNIDGSHMMYYDFSNNGLGWETQPLSFNRIETNRDWDSAWHNSNDVWRDEAWRDINNFYWDVSDRHQQNNNNDPLVYQAWDHNGTHYIFDVQQRFRDCNRDKWRSAGFYVTQITDVHGNSVKIDYEIEQPNNAKCNLKALGEDDLYTSAIRPNTIRFIPSGASSETVKITFHQVHNRPEGATTMESNNYRTTEQIGQPFYSEWRVIGIEVEAKNDQGVWQTYRNYDLTHKAVMMWRDKEDVDTEPDGEIYKQNEKNGHMLLEKLQISGVGGESLPEMNFKYTTDEPNGNKTDAAWNHARLVEVDNGYGGIVKFQYEDKPNLVCNSGYHLDAMVDFDDGDPINRKLGRYVVQVIETYDQADRVSRVEFEYHDPECRIDYAENPNDLLARIGDRDDARLQVSATGSPWFMGFGKVIRKNNDGDNQSINEIHSNYHTIQHRSEVGNIPHAAAGRPSLVEIKVGTTVLQSSATTWTSKDVTAIPNNIGWDLQLEWVYKEQEVETLDTKQTKTDYHYGANVNSTVDTPDSYGYPSQIIAYGEAGNPNDNLITAITYNHNHTTGVTQPYILGLQKQVEVRGYDGESTNALLRHTEYYYDQNPTHRNNLNINQKPTKGYLNAVIQQVDDDGQEQLTRSYYEDPNNPTFNNNPYGNLTRVVDANGNETQTEYDDIHHVLPIKITNAKGQAVEFDYDYVQGLVTKETDANYQETAYGYDGLGRLKWVIQPGYSDHNESTPTLKYTYSSVGTIPFRVTAQQRVDTDGEAVKYISNYSFYNGLGQLVQTHALAETEDGTQRWRMTRQFYNAQGLVEYVGYPEDIGNGGGNYYNISSLPNLTTHSTYDELGRPTQTTFPDGRSTSVQYADWEQTLIDANGRTRKHTSDAFGRLTRVEEYEGNETSTTHYKYNAVGELLRVTDAAENPTHITYDMLGRKTSMDDPDMGQWYYYYDEVGNLIAQVDAKKQATDLYYDELNRLEGKIYRSGPVNPIGYTRGDIGQGGYTIAYTYDQADNTHGAGVGRRTSMRDEAGTVDWTYDERGRVTKVTRDFLAPYNGLDNSQDGDGYYTLAYTYDSADRVRTLTYPDGEQVSTNQFSAGGLPKQLTTNLAGTPNNYVNSVSYDLEDRLRELNLGNNLVVNYVFYDHDYKDTNTIPNDPTVEGQGGALRRIYVNDGNGNVIFDVDSYIYDKVGNIREFTDQSAAVGTRNLEFTYDDLDRLKTASSMGSTTAAYNYTGSYAYDAIGNFESRNGQNYGYDSTHGGGPHAVSDYNGNEYYYDANGNMRERTEDGTTYEQEWDVENRLAKVIWDEGSDKHTTGFVYDGDGNRLLKIETTRDAATNTVNRSVTTLYIGKLYEETLETTDTIFVTLVPTLSTEPAVALSDSPELDLHRAPGLAYPLSDDLTLTPSWDQDTLMAPTHHKDVNLDYVVGSLGVETISQPDFALSEVFKANLSSQLETTPILTPTTELPADVSQDWWVEAQEAIRLAEYDITWQEQTYLPDQRPAYQAPNRANNLRSYFTEEGLRVIPRESDTPAWQWGMTLTAYGYEGQLIPVGEATLVIEGNRAEYQYEPSPTSNLQPFDFAQDKSPTSQPPLTEWYLNDERGVEQGFTLTEPPGEAKVGQPLVIALDLLGTLQPQQISDQEITFSNQAGTTLRYGGLYAFDATGRELPARMVLMDGTLQIHAEDDEAVYPITIDPLVENATWTAEGDQANAAFGSSVSTAGDVNGDGYDDIIIGAAEFDIDGKGKVYVWYGSPDGLGDPQNADWTAEGDQDDSAFGSSVSTAGNVNGNINVNGDKYDDIIIGAYNHNFSKGKVYVWYGGPDGLGDPQNPDWTAEGDDLSGFGGSVSTAGDVNNDGIDDIIVGASGYDGGAGEQNEGKVYVWYGSIDGLGDPQNADWTAESNQQYALFGSSVSTAGDVDGDGSDDIIVGAYAYNESPDNPTENGWVFVWYGGAPAQGLGPNGHPGNANWIAKTDQLDFFGISLSTGGNINGDPYDDIIIGAPAYDNAVGIGAGKAFVWYGGPSGLGDPQNANWTVEGDQEQASLGEQVNLAGDVNNDGYDDIIIGGGGYNDNKGKVFVWYGGPGGLGDPQNADWTVEGDQTLVGFGKKVSTAGDVDADGYDEVIVGMAGTVFNDDPGTVFIYPFDYTPPQNPDPTTATEINNNIPPKQWTNHDDPVFTWSGATDSQSDIAEYWVYFGSDPNGESTNSNDKIPHPVDNDDPYEPDSNLLSDTGEYYLRVRTKDSVGNWNDEWITLFDYWYDATAPDNPDTANEIKHGIISEVWTTLNDPQFTWDGASDQHAEIAQYEVYFGTDEDGADPSPVETILHPVDNADLLDDTDQYIPAPLSASGRYYLRLRTQDTAGNWSAWSDDESQFYYAYWYDGEAPVNPDPTSVSIQGTVAESGEWQHEVDHPTFTWDPGQDPHSGIALYELGWDTTEATNPTIICTIDPDGNPLECQVPAAVAHGSTHYLQVRTTDRVGHQADWETLFEFKYDEIAPEIGDVVPADNDVVQEAKPLIEASFIEAQAIDEDNTKLYLDNQQVLDPLTFTSDSVNYTPETDLLSGIHHVTLHLVDQAGHKTVESWSFTVNAETGVEIISPPDGTVFNQQDMDLLLEMERSDDLTLDVKVNGTLVHEDVAVIDGSWNDTLTLPAADPPNYEIEVTVTEVVKDADPPVLNTHTETINVSVDTAQHVALVRADPVVFNPNNLSSPPPVFYVTVQPGAGWVVKDWQLNLLDGMTVIHSVVGQALTQQVTWADLINGATLTEPTYDYELVLTVEDENGVNPDQTVTYTGGAVSLITQVPAPPTLTCEPIININWFNVPPGMVDGEAPVGTLVQVYLDGASEPAVVAPVNADGKWAAALPLNTLDVGESIEVKVDTIDAAGNISLFQASCQVGLEIRNPFVAPLAFLSETTIGLNDSPVTLTAHTRRDNEGADVNLVQAIIPTADPDTPLPLLETGADTGVWEATWNIPTTGDIEGVVVVEFEAQDLAGNEGYQFVQPYLDLVPPWVTITWPSTGYDLGSPQFALRGEAELLSEIEIIISKDGNPLATESIRSNALGWWVLDVDLEAYPGNDQADGTYQVTAQAVADRADNVGLVSAPVSFVVDRSGPTLSNLTVTPPFIQRETNLAVEVTAVDDLAGVRSVWATLTNFEAVGPNESRLFYLADIGNDQYKRFIKIPTISPEGEKSVTVEAEDGAGNPAASPQVTTFIVDHTSPLLQTLTLDPLGATDLYVRDTTLYYSAESIAPFEVSIEASDEAAHPTAGLDSVSFPAIFGTSEHVQDLDGVTAIETYSHQYIVDGSQDLDHDFEIEAEDRAGNSATSPSFHIEQDRTAPGFSNFTVTEPGNSYYDAGNMIFYYNDNTTGDLNLSITYQDSQAGLNQVTFPTLFGTSVDPQLFNGFLAAETFSEIYTIDANQGLDGRFDLEASDMVGNVRTLSLGVVKDTTAPTLDFTLPTGNIGAQFTIEWDANDPDSNAGLPGSGVVALYTVEYHTGDNVWQELATDITETSLEFTQGEVGTSYTFRVTVKDRLDNSTIQVSDPVTVNKSIHKNYFFNGQMVATRQDDDLYFIHGDHLGSASVTTDEDGIIVAEARYKPYGEELRAPGGDPLPTDFGFTGQRNEASFGLMDYNARYYSPVLGRFISPDTIVPGKSNPQAWNRYAYVFNNPLNFTDSTGHCPPCDDPYYNSVVGWQRKADKGISFDTYLAGQEQYAQYNANNYLYLQDKLIFSGIIEGDSGAALSRLQVAKVYAHYYAGTDLDQLLPAEAFNDVVDLAQATGDGAKVAQAFLYYLMVVGMSDYHDEIPSNHSVGNFARSLARGFCNSFSAETLVMTEDGLEPISTLQIGTKVLAYNEVTGEVSYYPITHLWEHEDPIIVYLTINDELIETTPEHPFFTAAGLWLDAGDLQAGHKVYNSTGHTRVVEAIEFVDQPQIMYNLTVDEAHTFFVGHGQWLVHNSDCWIGKNLKGGGTVKSGRLKGYTEGSTDLQGGIKGAEDTFETLTGRRPNPYDPSSRAPTDQYIEAGKLEVRFRPNSRTGTPALEVINHEKQTVEKIHFNP